MEKTDWKKWASMLICIAFAVVFFGLFCKYLLSPLTPFLLAAVLALLIVPPASKLARKTKSSAKLWAIIFLLIVLVVIVLLTVLIVNRLYYELSDLLERITSDSGKVDEYVGEISDWISRLSAHIPWLDGLRETERLDSVLDQFDLAVSELIRNTIQKLTSSIPEFAVSLISGLPMFFLTVTVFLIAGFYFCVQPEKILTAVKSVIPQGIRERMSGMKERVTGTLVKFVKAYLLIMFITFAELFIGFKIIGVEFALILAAIIAVVDILPVLGTGTVLIPWAVFELFTGGYRVGCGLLIIYGVVLIVRQLIEPRLVGKSIGLHPLITLAAMYFGLRLFGIAGMVIAPITAALVKVWRESGRETDQAGNGQAANNS